MKTSLDSTVYRIAKWDEVFERAESRKLKTLTWVSVPTSFNSNGYQCMLDEFQDSAPAIYGAWCALVAIAASCTVRGTLCNSRGTPLPTTHLARISGFPRPIFDELINWASQPEIGWLVPSSESEIIEKLRENDTSGDRRGIVGGSPGEFPDYQTRPDQTRPDITQPNPTQPDKTGAGLSSVVGVGVVSSVGAEASTIRPPGFAPDCADGPGREKTGGGGSRSLGRKCGALEVVGRLLTEEQLFAVSAEAVDALGARLSEPLLGFGLDKRAVGRLARVAIAAGVRSSVLEAARSLRLPSVRSPRRYWDAAIKKIFAEAGIDLAAAMELLQEVADRKAAKA